MATYIFKPDQDEELDDQNKIILKTLVQPEKDRQVILDYRDLLVTLDQRDTLDLLVVEKLAIREQRVTPVLKVRLATLDYKVQLDTQVMV